MLFYSKFAVSITCFSCDTSRCALKRGDGNPAWENVSCFSNIYSARMSTPNTHVSRFSCHIVFNTLDLWYRTLFPLWPSELSMGGMARVCATDVSDVCVCVWLMQSWLRKVNSLDTPDRVTVDLAVQVFTQLSHTQFHSYMSRYYRDLTADTFHRSEVNM